MARPVSTTWVVGALFLVLLAGCVGDGEQAARSGPDAAPTSERAESDAAGSTTTRAPDGDVGAADAPQWVPGQWWRWQATPRDAPEYEVRTAVARIEAGHYLIGWGSVEEGLRSQFLHFVPSGPVSTTDLSWGAHHEDVAWLDFPLMDGKMWEGGLWLDDMRFQATATEVGLPDGASVPGFHVAGANEEETITADIWWAIEPPSLTGLDFYLHDAETPWFSLRLLEQGLGATEIHLLHGDLHDARFSHLPTQLENGEPPAVLELLEIDAEVTHVAMGCYLGGAAGHYAFELSKSDEGTSYGCQNDQSGDGDPVLMLDWGPVNAGTWTRSHRTVGEGTLFVELFLLREEIVTP